MVVPNIFEYVSNDLAITYRNYILFICIKTTINGCRCLRILGLLSFA